MTMRTEIPADAAVYATSSAPSRYVRGRRWQRATIATFLVLLAIPSLDLAFGLDPNPSPLREAVPFPSLSLGRAFPGKLFYYLQSNMGFRASLVRARGLLAYHLLGVSPAPTSVVLQSPWLFGRGERVIEDFRRIDRFRDADLDRWESVLEARRAWLEQRGIQFIVVIAPNKETIYPEAMPAWATRSGGPSRLSQLVTRLRARTGVDVVDLREALEAAKRERRVYHYTDTHWNDAGAFAGYRAIAHRLRALHPSLLPLEWSGLGQRVRSTRGGDLARICGLQSDLREPHVELSPLDADDAARFEDGSPLRYERMDVRGLERFVTRAPAGEIPSAVILRDSFAELLIPFLSRHFRTATWIWTYDFPVAEIESRHPTLVIEQLVERKLMTLEPANPPELAGAGDIARVP